MFENFLDKYSGNSEQVSFADIMMKGWFMRKVIQTFNDSIKSSSSFTSDLIVEKDEIRRVIVDAIDDLTDEEKKMLVLYYYENLTLNEIGKVLGYN
jgi:RNA polymerase sigma factor for flagellar operon FliA